MMRKEKQTNGILFGGDGKVAFSFVWFLVRTRRQAAAARTAVAIAIPVTTGGVGAVTVPRAGAP